MEEVWKIYKVTKCSNKYRKAGVYEVSNFGRVRHNSILLDTSNNLGYERVGGFKVHRAVAELFIPNHDNKPFIDHIDTNPSNNHVNNLRWCTQKENCNNPLTRQHMSRGAKTRKYSPEHHIIQSEAQKIAQNRPDVKKKKSDSLKGKNKGKPCPTKGKHKVWNDPNDHSAGFHYEKKYYYVNDDRP